MGLRESKKLQTRQAIAATGMRLFVTRGFDHVTVGEIAREAGVSEKTVFNYFPTKEDLFYSRLEAFEEGLLGAVRRREPGESVLAAFRGFLAHFRIVPLTPEVAEEAVRLRRQHRLKLPDAIIWASALNENCVLVSRNTKVFPANQAGIRFPYRR